MVELLAVIVVLATVAGFVVAAFDAAHESSAEALTRATLRSCRDAIVGVERPGRSAANGFRHDLRAMPRTIADLLRAPPWAPADDQQFDFAKGVGWRGPYLRAPTEAYAWSSASGGATSGFTALYGEPGEPTVLDGWGRPIVLQRPDPDGLGVDAIDDRHLRLVSAGPDAELDTPPGAYFPSLTECDDDLVVYLMTADLREP